VRAASTPARDFTRGRRGAAGVDDADLAAIAGHTVLTMVTHYTHALGRSFDQVRGVIG
jgi:hypothetical protein